MRLPPQAPILHRGREKYVVSKSRRTGEGKGPTGNPPLKKGIKGVKMKTKEGTELNGEKAIHGDGRRWEKQANSDMRGRTEEQPPAIGEKSRRGLAIKQSRENPDLQQTMVINW